jgi:hypothetical protein
VANFKKHPDGTLKAQLPDIKKDIYSSANDEDARNQELGDQAAKQGYPITAKQYKTGNTVPYSNEAEGREESRLMNDYTRRTKRK